VRRKKMDNIPQSDNHVACDVFFDAKLVGIVHGEYAVFNCSGNLQAIRMNVDEDCVGKTGVLTLYHTVFGASWQFLPYSAQTWRRVPEQDVPGKWTWQCQETAQMADTPVGVAPDHTPTHLPHPDDEAEFFI
jgi:hypothetical protein